MTNLKTMLDALEAAVKAATPGPVHTIEPWRVYERSGVVIVSFCGLETTNSDDAANAAEYVALKNSAPVLIAIARAAAEYRLASKRVEASESAHHDGHDCDCVSAWDACDSAYAALFAALDRAEAEAADRKEPT